MSGKEVVKLLEKNGWEFERQLGTSHMIYKKYGISCPVPDHKEIAKGTLGNIKRIVKQAEKQSEK